MYRYDVVNITCLSGIAKAIPDTIAKAHSPGVMQQTPMHGRSYDVSGFLSLMRFQSRRSPSICSGESS